MEDLRQIYSIASLKPTLPNPEIVSKKRRFLSLLTKRNSYSMPANGIRKTGLGGCPSSLSTENTESTLSSSPNSIECSIDKSDQSLNTSTDTAKLRILAFMARLWVYLLGENYLWLLRYGIHWGRKSDKIFMVLSAGTISFTILIICSVGIVSLTPWGQVLDMLKDPMFWAHFLT